MKLDKQYKIMRTNQYMALSKRFENLRDAVENCTQYF